MFLYHQLLWIQSLQISNTGQCTCLSYLDDINKMLSVINCYSANSKIGVEVSSVHNYRIDWDHLDTLAHSLWPRDGLYYRSDSFQKNTSAAGDCLPCSISRLVAGTEFHAQELRTCMTIEAVKNRTWYLDHNNLILSCLPMKQLRFVTC